MPSQLTQGNELTLKGARHPVIEQQLPLGTPYIANDLELDRDTQQIMMITGPNMSGKSAILRQTALIVLLLKWEVMCQQQVQNWYCR